MTPELLRTGHRYRTVTTVSFNATDLYDTDSMHDPVGAPTDIIINTSGSVAASKCVQVGRSCES